MLAQGLRDAKARSGFTLIELLVVISILGILATLGIMFLPSLGSKERAARGGSALQGWLREQRYRALRDQIPRGLRLIPGATNTLGATNGRWVAQCQFIEQPDDYSSGQAFTGADQVDAAGNPVAPPYRVFFNGTDLTVVQAGDQFEFLGTGLMHRITTVDSANNFIDLASPIPFRVQPTTNYRIVRAPRATSEDIMQLPDDVVIDLNTNTAFGVTNPLMFDTLGQVDILFGPSGQITTPGFVGETINLWVRDSTEANEYNGDPTIVAVHRATGLITAHPPSPLPDPYQYVRDGRSSVRD